MVSELNSDDATGRNQAEPHRVSQIGEPPPDPGDSVMVLPQAVVQAAGAMDLFEGSFRRSNR